MFACYYGHKDVVKLLLDHSGSGDINFNAKNSVGSTGFMLACKKGCKDVVQLLLDHSERIDLNARDDNGKTAFMMVLHCACDSSKNPQLVKKILQQPNIDINAKDENGDTALRLAVEHQNFEIIQEIVNYGVERGIKHYVVSPRDLPPSY